MYGPILSSVFSRLPGPHLEVFSCQYFSPVVERRNLAAPSAVRGKQKTGKWNKLKSLQRPANPSYSVKVSRRFDE